MSATQFQQVQSIIANASMATASRMPFSWQWPCCQQWLALPCVCWSSWTSPGQG